MSTYTAISDFLFAQRKHIFVRPDLVIYHPGHYTELNDQIIQLYQHEGFSKITLSSAPNRFLHGKSEYEVHKPILVEGGIPEHDIIHITEGSSMEEIVKFSFHIPLQQGFHYKTVLLAGKAFFMRRFFMLSETYAPEDSVIDVLGLKDNRNITKDHWMHTETGIQRVSGELEKIARLLKETR
ncbi:YdcF family protein [Brevibacillus migulae]|uniref:hypothetical protein n=1 Tax=Brevibacillus migulae TaxID=1644114 RepID=UPI00106DFD7F|nr:hypothetical protein [Brevibacillus migulae]